MSVITHGLIYLSVVKLNIPKTLIFYLETLLNDN